MSPRIEEAKLVLADYKARYDAIVLEVQAGCLHSTVAENTDHTWPRRICTQCGLEEEGSHYSYGEHWSRKDWKQGELGNKDARRVKPVEWVEFARYRP